MLDILSINEYKNNRFISSTIKPKKPLIKPLGYDIEITKARMYFLENNLCDIDDQEFMRVINSSIVNLKLPNVFTKSLFKSIYGVNIKDVIFKNNDCLDWEFSNIIFNPVYRV
jgi:hypothetical protein